MRNDAVTAELALTIVRDHGLKSIWQLNVIAAETYRYGRPGAAAAILKIADAVEIHWIPARAAFVVLIMLGLIKSHADPESAAGTSAFGACREAETHWSGACADRHFVPACLNSPAFDRSHCASHLVTFGRPAMPLLVERSNLSRARELHRRSSVSSCETTQTLRRQNKTSDQMARTGQTNETDRLISSDKVEGTTVYNRNGENLGTH